MKSKKKKKKKEKGKWKLPSNDVIKKDRKTTSKEKKIDIHRKGQKKMTRKLENADGLQTT